MVKIRLGFLNNEYCLLDLFLYQEPDIVNKKINIRMSGCVPLTLDVDFDVTWTKAQKLRAKNRFILRRCKKKTKSSLNPGIFYMPYNWFNFQDEYYTVIRGFATEHRRRMVSRKIPGFVVEDMNYEITEDLDKKKEALELFHELISIEHKKVNEEYQAHEDYHARMNQAQDDYEKTLTRIEFKYEASTIENKLAVLDPFGKIREEYDMVAKKLIS
jgi:hypothetical protein